jgi:hypothetical protein
VPRHPPSALTSLTTGKRLLPSTCLTTGLRAAPADGQAINLFSPLYPIIGACFVTHIRTSTSSTIDHLKLLTIRAREACSFQSSFVLRTSFNYSIFRFFAAQARYLQLARVGQERLELSTPRLSSACSNQLSYWPNTIGRIRSVSQDRIAIRNFDDRQSTKQCLATLLG